MVQGIKEKLSKLKLRKSTMAYLYNKNAFNRALNARTDHDLEFDNFGDHGYIDLNHPPYGTSSVVIKYV